MDHPPREEGRNALNFSEWNQGGGRRGDHAAEAVRNGSMPPSYYTWFGMHSNAKLSAAQRQQLADGLAKTLGNSGG